MTVALRSRPAPKAKPKRRSTNLASPKGRSERNCSVARTIDIVSDAWAFLIIREAFFGTRTFEAFRSALEIHLRHEPEKASRSRIKRLRGLLRPQYRLRVGEIRVFFDVSGATVEVLAIVAKSEAQLWLAQFADPE